MRLGVSPIGWTNDDLPELGDDIPLEQCLAEARAAGFEGIELGRKFPRRAGELGPLLAAHGLRLVSGWYGARLRERPVAAELEALQPHLDLLAAMGSGVMVFAEVSGAIHAEPGAALSGRPRLAEAEWAPFGAALTAVAERLLGRGVRLAYHPHVGTVVETADEVDRLLAVTGDAVGLVLDTGHLALAGADPVGVARRHGARIVHVHCKDVRPDVVAEARRSDWSFPDAVRRGVFTVPGDGALDYAALLQVLADVGYAGWLVVEAEQDPAQAPPFRYARLGHNHLRALLAAPS